MISDKQTWVKPTSAVLPPYTSGIICILNQSCSQGPGFYTTGTTYILATMTEQVPERNKQYPPKDQQRIIRS